MKHWTIRLGRWLFRHRSLTPLPMILMVLICFAPRHYGSRQFWVTAAAVTLAALGEGVRILAVGFSHTGTSGRESYLRADALNVTGIYSLVRNPLYIGNTLIHGGVLVFWGNPWALLLMLGFLWIQYALIVLGEESFLSDRHGEAYRQYQRTVRRILPCPGNYRPPESPFKLRKVLLKENDSVFNMLAMMLLLAALRQQLLQGKVSNWPQLAAAGGLLVALYVGIKVWKKSSVGVPPAS